MQMQAAKIKIGVKALKGIASSIATEVVDKLYYGLLIARYIPEIKAIEAGQIKPLRGEGAKTYLEKRILTGK